MKHLDPKALWLFYIQSVIGFVISLFSFLIIFFLFPVRKVAEALELPGIVLFLIDNWWILLILMGLIQLIWVWLYYQYYKYELTEDGFKKELGVIQKRYVTIPYDRIQNVDIQRGIFARLLGLSDLRIQTAGMSATAGKYSASGAGSEGHLPGVSREEAEVLRDELIKRAHGKTGQGL